MPKFHKLKRQLEAKIKQGGRAGAGGGAAPGSSVTPSYASRAHDGRRRRRHPRCRSNGRRRQRRRWCRGVRGGGAAATRSVSVGAARATAAPPAAPAGRGWHVHQPRGSSTASDMGSSTASPRGSFSWAGVACHRRVAEGGARLGGPVGGGQGGGVQARCGACRPVRHHARARQPVRHNARARQPVRHNARARGPVWHHAGASGAVWHNASEHAHRRGRGASKARSRAGARTSARTRAAACNGIRPRATGGTCSDGQRRSLVLIVAVAVVAAAVATAPPTEVAWVVQAAELAKYDAIFEVAKEPNGKVGGAKAAAVLRRSGLPNATLYQVWSLVDVHTAGEVDREWFALAMYMTARAKRGQPLPRTDEPLPMEMVLPSQRRLRQLGGAGVESAADGVMQSSMVLKFSLGLSAAFAL